MIGESELILNRDGSIYHLNLLPGEIADTIITVGDPERVMQVSKYFVNLEVKKQKREFLTHTGYLAGKRLTVISTGIGTDNIDIVINELDALVNIDLTSRTLNSEKRKLRIIRLGTSGALHRDTPVDSIVASQFAIGLDNLLNFYRLQYSDQEKNLLHAFVNHVQKSHISFIPYIASGSPNLLSMFDHEVSKGITVTCPGFYGPQGRTVRAPLAYPNLIDMLSSFHHEKFRLTNFEMETSGIYGVAKILGHEAISLSIIVANRSEKKFSSNSHEAVEKLIRFALERIVAS